MEFSFVGLRGFLRWDLDDEGGGEVRFVPYDSTEAPQSHFIGGVDELDPRLAHVIKLSGRQVGEVSWPP